MPNNADKRRCSECGAQTPRDAALCPSCGAQMAQRSDDAQCPSCGARMSPQGVCPICGAQGQLATPSQRSSRAWMALLALVLLLLGGMGWVLGGEQVVALWLAQAPSRSSAPSSSGQGPLANPEGRATIAINLPKEAQKLLAAVAPAATPTVMLTSTASPDTIRTTQPTATATWTATWTPEPSATPTPTASPTPNPTEPPEPTAIPTPEPETYEVQSGDNPWTISRQFGLTMEELLTANGLSEGALLQVGQVLQIPQVGAVAQSVSATDATVATPTPTPEPVIHTIASGDTLGGLAAKYDVSSAEIARVNDISLDHVLSVGDRLVIPDIAPSPEALALAVDATSTATATAAPTVAPTTTPTSTPEPVVHTVASGDTLGALAVRYGVVSEEIARVNDISLDQTLRIGDALIIPDTTLSPTPTTPVAAGDNLALAADTASAATAAADATPAPSPEATATPAPAATPEPVVHTVARGDTLGGLAVKYDVSSAEIASANNMSLNRVLRIGDTLLIPITTPIPTNTPEATATSPHTPTGTPTITRTPSPTNTSLPRFPYRAPYLLGPPRESVFVGADARILLNWTSVGILAPQEWYALRVWAPGDEQPTRVLTKASSWRLPASMYPKDRADRTFIWQVVVVLKGTDADSEVSISLPSNQRTFSWH
jgi:LysM repeat protein